MEAKRTYHIRNWSQYNKSLVQRGSITFWFSDDALDSWLAEPAKPKKGHPPIYSDEAILFMLMIKVTYRLSYRALEGFVKSIMEMLELDLPVPCYTQVSRRAKALEIKIRKLSQKQPKEIVFDSTGLKVYGEGEWKVRQHGYSKRRVWRKIHLAVCPETHLIMLQTMTTHSTADCSTFPYMVKQLPRSVKKTSCDGAYDTELCYKSAYEQGLELIVPPRKGARIKAEPSPWIESRNNAIKEVRGLRDRSLWKKLKGYHKRSLAETAMFRLKALFGNKLRNRVWRSQAAEVYARCLALNKMTSLGMPDGEWVMC